MSENEELVKTLHHCVASMNCATCTVENIDKEAKKQQRCVTLLLAKAADAIEKLQGMLYLMKKTAEWLNEKIPRWTSVDEALPEKYGTVLVTTERGSVMVCCYYPQAKNWNTRAKVKWWMPLPQPPQEANDGADETSP